MDKVKLGLVGTGDIGTLHAQAAAQVDGVDLCIAAGTNPEKAKELAGSVHAQLYESYDALLGDDSVQAVDICVPNHLHREFAAKAFQAGKHVLCEKPIALTLGDADAMIEESEKADKILMVGHLLRFWPEYAKTKEMIENGELREPQVISGRRLVSLLLATTGQQGWRHDPARSGGAVIDLQIHDLDFYCWLFGAPRSVISQGIRSEDGALSHVFTLLDFPGGQKAFIEASFMLKGNPLAIDFKLLCSDSSLEYAYVPVEFELHDLGTKQAREPSPSLILYRWEEDPKPIYTPEQDSFPLSLQNEIAYFAQCVREGNPPTKNTPQESRRALKICLAAQESCETGEAVEDDFE